MEGRHYPPPPRRPYLRFPPPPPFPPADYAYAYYEPGAATTSGGGTGKHTFITRYGTEENIYEEIGASQLEEEVRYVHSRHLQVLDELNLTVEAMLMPEGGGGEGAEELSGGPDELLSPATCSLDSGFSGSSTGTNSLGRNPPSTPKTKKAPPFWKKLPGLHPTTPAPSPAPCKPLDEARCGSSWDESSRDQSQRSSGSEPDLSSGDESSKSVDARQNGKARSLWRRNSPSPDPPPPPGRLSRWFSIRRGSQYDLENKERGKMPLLPEVEEEGGLSHRRLLPPSLPPPPPHLSPQELKRRHIVAAIIQSENSYLATLHRLVNDYKKPLEESSPAILSATKIQTLFHRLPEILQCHTLFRIALAEAVANWDRDHRIGDVFVASFSKAIVLDIYSGFINNFSVAMELARAETKRKPALAEFFKARQVSSHDRLSFFGLMVKPVQRFPQFILFLQDLLHHTGHGHPDRMSLQLALTQLESLAELLNERKREAEQSQAFRDMLRAISGKLSAKNIGDNHCLLRQDDVTQMELNQCGLISQYKSRRLLLLNDLLVCVSVSSKQDSNTSSPQRLNLKWTCPISEVQVVENNTSPTLSRLLTPNNGVASSNGVTENLCSEMSRLMQDYQTVSRIAELAGKLHGSYPELSPDVTRGLLNYIQCEIQHKDDQMAWVDSCCLQLSLRNKDETYTFQMDSPDARKEWITELRLARLALDPSNSPSWEVPDQEVRPCTKMPLFVAAHPVYTSQQHSEVVCGCFYTAACGKSYLWVCTTDGTSSHISIAQTAQTLLKPITQFTLPDVRVSAMEYVRGVEAVWIGTQCQQLLVYSVTDVDHPEQTHSIMLSGDVVVIKQHCDSVFVALSTGRLLVFRRHQLTAEPEEIVLGTEPVSCLLPINLSMYAACGKTVTVLRAITGEIQKNFTIQHEHVGGNVNLMATSGVGLWLSLSHSSTICLYHTETFKHLQDINVASNVVRLTGAQGPVAVTALMACKGLLWVGTDAGVSLTVPLPRLEGVPIISGRVSVSYHAHVGPTRLLLPLQDPPTVVKRPPSKALACDIYGLYGQLMYVKDYDGDDERLDMSHWSLSTSSEESGAPRHTAANDRREHTLVTITGGRGYVNLQQPCCTTITNNAHILLWEMKL